MPFRYWRWHVERDPDTSSGLPFGWYEPFAKHQHQLFARSGAHQIDAPLRVTLETGGLVSMLSDDGSDGLSTLLHYIRSRGDLIQAARTPPSSVTFVPEVLAEVPCIQFGEVRESSHVGFWREASLKNTHSGVRETPIDDVW